jgi:hypothetical protein
MNPRISARAQGDLDRIFAWNSAWKIRLIWSNDLAFTGGPWRWLWAFHALRAMIVILPLI